MPVCFQLFSKETGQPAVFQRIDDEMRVHFEQPPDDKAYLCSWYNSIGERLAMGWSFDKIRARFDELDAEKVAAGREPVYRDGLTLIVQYLQERYDTNSFYQPKELSDGY